MVEFLKRGIYWTTDKLGDGVIYALDGTFYDFRDEILG